MASIGTDWERYGRAVIRSMTDVLQDAADDHHPILLETADYWLSLGIAIGLRHPGEAERLLAVIEEHEPARMELREDADEYCRDVLP
jgi:hypothetical protein